MGLKGGVIYVDLHTFLHRLKTKTTKKAFKMNQK